MFRIVIGGAASGKSEYAENSCMKLDGTRVYLATMESASYAASKRIARHRKNRRGKGFATIECEWNLPGFLEMHSDAFAEKNVLLEDLPNLVANEMFGGDVGMDAPAFREGLVSNILTGIYRLRDVARHLTIVTADFASDGISYPAATEAYLLTLGCIQNTLSGEADEVIEVVAKIPSKLK